jgi:hypothetical protein
MLSIWQNELQNIIFLLLEMKKKIKNALHCCGLPFCKFKNDTAINTKRSIYLSHEIIKRNPNLKI